MPNTVIALKKSSVPDAVPADLANGELALNFADGKLYYKRANGQITFIASPAQSDSFGTINANGTLIISDSTSDVLTIEQGSNIIIVGDAVNDKITISANLTLPFDRANNAFTNSQAAFAQANNAFTNSQVAFGQANNAFTNSQIAFGQANNAFTNSQFAFAKANAALPNTTATLNGSLTITGSLFATSKSFVINHPTKDGMVLNYGSLEGPENAVYFRGKISNKSIIELPDYWWNLIDQDTMTVHLTPYGRTQDIWVQSTSTHFIYLNQPADCYYIVYAERKDIDKLVVEY